MSEFYAQHKVKLKGSMRSGRISKRQRGFVAVTDTDGDGAPPLIYTGPVFLVDQSGHYLVERLSDRGTSDAFFAREEELEADE